MEESKFANEVFLAMSEEQAQKEGCARCITPPLSLSNIIDSKTMYLKLRDIDDRLCVSKEIGWETVICIRKENLPAVMDFLYDGQVTFNYQTVADKIEGDTVWIIGFDD